MKGLTHFVTGVALASCFPDAVRAGAADQPLYFVLGGVFGLLPDTLDFRFSRLLYRHDMEVIPDPQAPDPKLIADAVAHAIHRARATGKSVRIKLSTVRVGAGLWLQYRVKLDTAKQRVLVTHTGSVTTDRKPAPGGATGPRRASAPLECQVVLDYQAETEVDIFDGPVFSMDPTPDGKVHARFLPWHREWSHSFVVGALFALLGGLAWGLLAGLVIFGAYAAHAVVDQCGFMGSNLLFPFTRRRFHGLQRAHSDDAFANFALIWTACLVIFWNLARGAPLLPGRFSLVHLLLYGALLPLLAVKGLDRILKRMENRGKGAME